MLKSYRWVGWGGGPWDFSVSPSPFGLYFGTLDFGTSALGLTIQVTSTNKNSKNYIKVVLKVCEFCHRFSHKQAQTLREGTSIMLSFLESGCCNILPYPMPYCLIPCLSVVNYCDYMVTHPAKKLTRWTARSRTWGSPSLQVPEIFHQSTLTSRRRVARY